MDHLEIYFLLYLSAVLQAQLVLVQELYLMAQVQYTCAYLSLLYLYKYNKDR